MYQDILKALFLRAELKSALQHSLFGRYAIFFHINADQTYI